MIEHGIISDIAATKAFKQKESFLYVTNQLSINAINRGIIPQGIGLIIIQHLLDDTEQFIRILLQSGFRIIKIIGIEYSSKSKVSERLRNLKLNVIVPEFSILELAVNETIKYELNVADKSEKNRFIIHEVGGYCSSLLNDWGNIFTNKCLGIIEDTRQGLWRYLELDNIPIPLMQIADSKLKSIESNYVGEAVARAVESDLLELGTSLDSIHIGILGFGDIGSSVAYSLRCRGAVIFCYDPNPLRMMEAKAEGYNCLSRHNLLHESEIIIGASGVTSLNYNELELLKNEVILFSASSKDIEFPIKQIKEYLRSSIQLTRFINELSMPWGKKIRLANFGYPVNFRDYSLPFYISDLIFSQILVCITNIINKKLSPGIHSLTEDEEKHIAKLWLKQYLNYD